MSNSTRTLWRRREILTGQEACAQRAASARRHLRIQLSLYAVEQHKVHSLIVGPAAGGGGSRRRHEISATCAVMAHSHVASVGNILKHYCRCKHI